MTARAALDPHFDPPDHPLTSSRPVAAARPPSSDSRAPIPMRIPITLVTLTALLFLWACGEQPKPDVHSAPQSVVDAWIAAAKTGEKDAMLSLFVPAAREAEGQGKDSFTSVVVNLGVRLTSVEVSTPLKVEGDKATVAYGGHFREKDGKDHKDGLRFTLVKQADGWFIESLK